MSTGFSKLRFWKEMEKKAIADRKREQKCKKNPRRKIFDLMTMKAKKAQDEKKSLHVVDQKVPQSSKKGMKVDQVEKTDVLELYTYRQYTQYEQCYSEGAVFISTYTQYEWRTSAQIKRDEEKAKQSKISGIAEKKRGEKEDILDMYHQYTQYEWRTIEQMKRDDGKGTQKRKPKEDVYELYSERQYTGYESGDDGDYKDIEDDNTPL
eukprot:jgi/Bigna1/139408/aug1.50_g14116